METLTMIYIWLLEETDCKFQRYLHNQTDWNERLIAGRSAIFD